MYRIQMLLVRCAPMEHISELRSNQAWMENRYDDYEIDSSRAPC